MKVSSDELILRCMEANNGQGDKRNYRERFD